MNRFKLTNFLMIVFILAVGGADASVEAVGSIITQKLVKGDEVEVKEGTQFGVYNGRSISLPRY